LLGWAVLMLLVAGILLRTALIEKTTPQRVTTQQKRIMTGRPWRWQRPRIALPRVHWLFAGLILFVIGGTVWFSQQQYQTNVLLHQQQLRATLATAAEHREAHLLNNVNG